MSLALGEKVNQGNCIRHCALVMPIFSRAAEKKRHIPQTIIGEAYLKVVNV
jgi:hypothetical protein